MTETHDRGLTLTGGEKGTRDQFINQFPPSIITPCPITMMLFKMIALASLAPSVTSSPTLLRSQLNSKFTEAQSPPMLFLQSDDQAEGKDIQNDGKNDGKNDQTISSTPPIASVRWQFFKGETPTLPNQAIAVAAAGSKKCKKDLDDAEIRIIKDATGEEEVQFLNANGGSFDSSSTTKDDKDVTTDATKGATKDSKENKEVKIDTPKNCIQKVSTLNDYFASQLEKPRVLPEGTSLVLYQKGLDALNERYMVVVEGMPQGSVIETVDIDINNEDLTIGITNLVPTYKIKEFVQDTKNDKVKEEGAVTTAVTPTPSPLTTDSGEGKTDTNIGKVKEEGEATTAVTPTPTPSPLTAGSGEGDANTKDETEEATMDATDGGKPKLMLIPNYDVPAIAYCVVKLATLPNNEIETNVEETVVMTPSASPQPEIDDTNKEEDEDEIDSEEKDVVQELKKDDATASDETTPENSTPEESTPDTPEQNTETSEQK